MSATTLVWLALICWQLVDLYRVLKESGGFAGWLIRVKVARMQASLVLAETKAECARLEAELERFYAEHPEVKR